ncbi:THUMP-like domain-containing protein [Pedobacter alpinus]|uniref:THUMP-like domain-containing protein n=1 Tax=Pedobacter alpinus TaxID=1590643 RepID=A0ABW5TVM5_9SPHI
MNKFSDEKVQDFIQKNLKTDLHKLILKGSPFEGITIQEIATQIEGKNKTEKKLPTWYKTKSIIFPPKLNLEQSSSEITAAYKAQLINNGPLLDLTGGFGVDDYYFAHKASAVTYCELNLELSEIVKHNFEKLGIKNISFNVGDSKAVLYQKTKYDTIYVDPSRRAETGRVFLLKDCEPNVVEDQNIYLKNATKVIIKAAPMLDVQAALKDLKNVSEVHVVSVKNECKELLFILEDNKTEEPTIFCVLLNKDHQQIIPFKFSEEKTANPTAKPLLNYLYEPDVAILKAGLFKLLTTKYEVSKIHQHSHLYTSDELVDFPGKSFKVINKFLFDNFNGKQVPKQVNVVCRNFILKPDELKKKFKLKDGGNNFLFFTTNYKEQKIVILAEKT